MNCHYAALVGNPFLVLRVVHIVVMLVVRVVLIMLRKPIEQRISMQMWRTAMLNKIVAAETDMGMGHRSSRKEQRERQRDDENAAKHEVDNIS